MSGHSDGHSGSEWPVVFRAGPEELFGILSEPVTTPRGIGVVILTGGAFTPSISRNRFSVKLARRLAASGFHALRFDYRGVGESTGAIEGYSTRRPFTPDVVAAVEALRSRNLPSIVLVGTCFGARAAVSAVGRVPGIDGMALMSMPLRDIEEGQRMASLWGRDEGLKGFARRALRWRVVLGALNPARRGRYIRVLHHAGTLARRRLQRLSRNGRGPALEWVSPGLVESLREVVRREVPLLFLFGSEEDTYREFQRAQEGEVGTLLARAGSRVQVSTLDGSVQGLTTLWVQEAAMAHVQQWLESLVAVRPGPGLSAVTSPAVGEAL